MTHIRLFNSLIFLTASALLLLSGCNKAFDPVGAGSITVEASIGAMTKVTTDGVASSFVEGDKIAVYAWTGSAAAVPAERVVDGVVDPCLPDALETWQRRPLFPRRQPGEGGQ